MVDGVRLHHEIHGEGCPILCIHGGGSSSLLWEEAVATLAARGRVIAYDRRGCGRSERPDPYDRTSAAEHADDAAALVRMLDASPAVVIGRSFGGWVALELALRHPGVVRALALLEPDAPGLAPAMDVWIAAFADRMREVAARRGSDAVGEALIDEVAGPGVWSGLPDEVRHVLTGNGPALLASCGPTRGPRSTPGPSPRSPSPSSSSPPPTRPPSSAGRSTRSPGCCRRHGS